MREAVIVEAVRTPMGRRNGKLKDIHPVVLASQVMKEVVERAGRPGVRRDTYSVRVVNGVRQKPRRTRSEVVREARTQVVKVGTKPVPTSVRGADHLHWAGLAACESGGRPGAVDPSGTYGGLYQFDSRTWHSLGGEGRPQDASADEQTMRAKKLYVRRGAGPWPHCGARLHG